jgi:hypothetical protein
VTIVRTPPIRVMLWGPRTGAAGPAAILCVRQLGSQALLFAPQRVRISNQGKAALINLHVLPSETRRTMDAQETERKSSCMFSLCTRF